MFNRLKGLADSIDQRFQEEQARARAAQGLPVRSNSGARRPQEPRGSARPSRSASIDRRPKEGGPKGPDPNDFDPDFVIGDESEPSRTGTPGPGAGARGKNGQGEAALAGEEGDGGKQDELPQDVRVRLRKLERLEFKYQELLRSYRIAHARVSAIEPFEAALRENTPLTSINDPGALTEYLGQVNVKGEMVLDELKRVSGENASIKQQLDAAEKNARKAWDEVAQLKKRTTSSDDGDEGNAHVVTDNHNPGTNGRAAKSDTTIAKSPESKPVSSPKPQPESSKSPSLSARIRMPSIFSPKQNVEEPPIVSDSAEDLFSYDNELPRVESELQERQVEIEKLQGEVNFLRKDLASARDSTESMVKNLEDATKELNILRNTQRDSQSQSERLMAELEAADTKLRKLEHEKSSSETIPLDKHKELLDQAHNELEQLRRLNTDNAEKLKGVEELQSNLDQLKKDLEVEKRQGEVKSNTSNKLISGLKEELNRAKVEVTTANEEKERHAQGMQAKIDELMAKVEELGVTSPGEPKAATTAEADGVDKEIADVTATLVDENGVTGKKNKKKKKKAGKGGAATTTTSTTPNGTSSTIVSTEKADANHSSSQVQQKLELALGELKEKNATIEQLNSKIKDQEGLQEEINILQESLTEFDPLLAKLQHTKEKVQELEVQKEELNKTIEELRNELLEVRGTQASTSAASEKAHKDLAAQFEDLKFKSKSLETDLQVAQQLASSRFKDLSELRDKMQKAQPEVRSLKAENEAMKGLRKELDEKLIAMEKLQMKHDNLQTQVAELKKAANDKNNEISTLNNKLSNESDIRQKLENDTRRLKGDLSSAQSEVKNAAQSLERFSAELSQARQTVRKHEARIRELEEKLSTIESEELRLREEIGLKTAQYASAESLMNSMRDQTSEMATQLKEARDRCESLDEEVADAHRMLNERTREGEKMRRLLADVETRTDSRIREMRDRMDAAVEERERIEDEASAANRRRARDLEDTRSKLREVERELREVRDARDQLDEAQRDWKRRREELEQMAERSRVEGDEAKGAMGRLRDALNESEKQAQELEKQKAELRRMFEETKATVEKLEKRNKALGDEVRAMQLRPKPNIATHSPSVSGSPAGSRVMSPAPSVRKGSVAPQEQNISQTDYLKSILLQFLEMKEKKHQVQFVPTLATLLHLDNKDQQKWTAAIMAK